MNTFYASAERTDQKRIMEMSGLIRSSEILTKTLDNLSDVVAILDTNRQAVFANKALHRSIGYDGMDMALGHRPGEILNCIYASKMDGGCGTSRECSYCGAAQSIVESQKFSASITKECRITAHHEGGHIHFDLNVTSSPMEVAGEKYTLFVASDISNEKRRHAMERIFFHDVINKAGSLEGLLRILDEVEDMDEIRSTLSVIQSVTSDLLEEILSQRDLLRAEKGEMAASPCLTDPVRLVFELCAQMRVHPVASGKEIETLIDCDPNSLSTDRVLLKRILTNMIKNALEATPEGGTVNFYLSETRDNLAFTVQNDSVMSPEIRAQIFQRSFSTKGYDRGLGTYSMKLLGEKYLRGKVSFTSDKNGGTRFTIELPKQSE